MIKRTLVVVMVLLLSLSVFALTGCTPEETVTPDEPTVTIPEGTTIQFWHAMNGSTGDAVDALVAQFNEENEYGIVVEATSQGGYSDLHAKVVAALTAGEAPNMAQAYANNIMVYMDSDAIVQLDDYIYNEDYGVDDFEDILEGYRVENSNYPDGKFYSLPFNKSTEVLYYNETFFMENNLPVPTTWDEFKATSMAASEILGAPAFGYDSLQNMFITWTQQAGGQYTNNAGEILFDTAEGRAALQYFADGIEGGYFRTAGEDNYMSGPFNDEKAVMFIGSTSGSAYVGSDTFTWNCAQVPFGVEKKVIQQGSNMFMMKSTDAEQMATWEFMNFLMEPENTAYWAMNSGYLPVRQSARDLASYQEYVASGVNPTKEVGTSYDGSWYIFDPVFADSYSMRVAVGKAVEEVAAGLKDVDTAVTDAANSLK